MIFGVHKLAPQVSGLQRSPISRRDPHSPRKMGIRGAYFPGKTGIRIPIFTGLWGSGSPILGIPIFPWHRYACACFPWAVMLQLHLCVNMCWHQTVVDGPHLSTKLTIPLSPWHVALTSLQFHWAHDVALTSLQFHWAHDVALTSRSTTRSRVVSMHVQIRPWCLSLHAIIQCSYNITQHFHPGNFTVGVKKKMTVLCRTLAELCFWQSSGNTVEVKTKKNDSTLQNSARGLLQAELWKYSASRTYHCTGEKTLVWAGGLAEARSAKAFSTVDAHKPLYICCRPCAR